MKAARIIEPMRIEIVDVEKPEAGDGQILIQNKTTSICGSDMPDFLHERPMEYPRPAGFPGHENIGIVVQSRCEQYKEGDEVLALPGGGAGFAEYFTATPGVTVRLPKMHDELVIAQPLGTVIHACRKLFHPLRYSAGDEKGPLDIDSWKLHGTKVAIVGQGGIGLLFTAMMKIMGSETIIGIDPVGYRLEASKKMGATHIVNASGSDSIEQIKEITNGAMADIVVEAVGKVSTINDCITLARNWGVILAFGVPRKSIYDLVFPELFRKELKLLGSVGPQVQIDFPPAVDLVASGKMDVSPTISHRMPLDDIQKAFEMSVDKKDNAIKILLEV